MGDGDDASPSPTVLVNRHYWRTTQAARAAGLRPADPLATSLTVARQDAEIWHAYWQMPMPEMARTVDEAFDAPTKRLGLRFFYPGGRRPRPLAIYFHGGGFVLNGISTHERLMRDLAVRSGVPVCGVAYSRAPEHRFPSQLEEACAAVRHIVDHAAALGIRRDRIALCGDSAGANLAIATACRLRDEGELPIAFLLLLYGMFGTDFKSPSHLAFGDGRFGLSTARLRWFWKQYLASEAHWHDPAAVPLLADLRGLPPTLVIAAGLDCLRDDSLRLSSRLRASHVPCVRSLYDDLPHGFAIMAPAVPRADEAITEAADALARLRHQRGFLNWTSDHVRRRDVSRRLHAALTLVGETLPPATRGATASPPVR